jgi:hypothetical protein
LRRFTSNRGSSRRGYRRVTVEQAKIDTGKALLTQSKPPLREYRVNVVGGVVEPRSAASVSHDRQT